MTSNTDGGVHWAKMVRQHIKYPSWQALSLSDQAIYPWFKLEWEGPGANNNGRIQLSIRLRTH